MVEHISKRLCSQKTRHFLVYRGGHLHNYDIIQLLLSISPAVDYNRSLGVEADLKLLDLSDELHEDKGGTWDPDLWPAVELEVTHQTSLTRLG